MGVSVPLLSISIDLEREIEQQDAIYECRLELVTSRLLELFESHQIPATWAVADPALSAATPQILRSAIEHEVAVLGDRSWVGCGAGRSRFARELFRRVLSARAAGMSISTLALRHDQLDEHSGLLEQAEINVVRNSQEVACPVSAPSTSRIQTVYATAKFPQSSRWDWGWGTGVWKLGNWRLRNLIRQTARGERTTTHIVVDAARLIDSPDRHLAALQKILRLVAQLRGEGRIEARTLRQISSQHSRIGPVIARPAA